MHIHLTFDSLSTQFMQLSEDGQYAEALALLETNRALFDRPDIYANWVSCTQVMLGKPQAAIRTLQDALAEGTWWPPVILRDDPDYKALQGLPDFEAVVARCTRLFDETSRQSQPQNLVIEPNGLPAGTAAPLLVALHGRGENLHTHAALWSPAARLGWKTVLLGSSQVVGQDAYCWDNRDLAEKEVAQQFDQAIESKFRQAVLAGFSQSGGLVLRMVLSGQVAASGVLAIVPASFSDDDFEHLRNLRHLEGKRAVILASKNDHPWIKTANRLAALLEAKGVPHIYTVYDNLGHDFPPDFSQKLPEYLAFLAGSSAMLPHVV
jgi:predicted esterase